MKKACNLDHNIDLPVEKKLQRPFQSLSPSLALSTWEKLDIYPRFLNSLFWRRGFLLLWLGISMILHYEVPCSAAFRIYRDSDKHLSLISLSVSDGFSHVTLALNENALWKHV
jgi:hypothetical protein